jgi:pilus assembly protein Flp/PilA
MLRTKKSKKVANWETWRQILTYSFGNEALRAESVFEKGKPVARRGRKTLDPPTSPVDCQVAERKPTMRKFVECVGNFMKREDGPTAVEYAVMLALIIVVCITAITALGTNANKTFTSVSNTIATTAS